MHLALQIMLLVLPVGEEKRERKKKQVIKEREKRLHFKKSCI